MSTKSLNLAHKLGPYCIFLIMLVPAYALSNTLYAPNPPNTHNALCLLLCRGASGCLMFSVAVDEGHCSLGLRLTHTNKVWSSSVVEVKQGDLGVFMGRKPQLEKEVKLRSTSG